MLVTNTREFLLQGEDSQGNSVKLESYRLADTEEEFEDLLERPRASASNVGAGLGEYLCRALSHRATLSDPGDLAWLLASYARDGLARVEAASDAPHLATIRTALEDALGVRFKGNQGTAFFHSTLIQTLFYGIFSAWVLWSRQNPEPIGRFNWREASWHLRVPVLESLFEQMSVPGRLRSLDLVEVLDWASDALDRVDREAFLESFDRGEAVQYFYEPFLEAFDPDLRKKLGVWYTPSAVVRYMVARVDMALRDDLGIEDGLAAENVYILDPCCGTGAYVSEVLRHISQNLEARNLGALVGSRVREAATKRVFGFEIMPAPFVVSHLQVGLTLQELGAPLSEDARERAGIFLTNALTGWEPTVQKPLPFPELEEERDRAERVKREKPVLVVLGNPPYDGYADMAVDEERELSTAYRTTEQVRRPKGRGSNDPYVRFFRMAERRITEMTGQGVVCFISNYSWLDGLSFTGMRERYLKEFDLVRVDSLNGDKYKTGKLSPDGSPDPSIFSTSADPDGIQVGTAIATLVRKSNHQPVDTIGFRNLWGTDKLRSLNATAGSKPDALYQGITPVLSLGLPFVPIVVSRSWQNWPHLPELFPVSFPGVVTSRDSFLIDVDLNRLTSRIIDYFDAELSDEEIGRLYPSVMKSTGRFAARSVRSSLLEGGPPDHEDFVRYTYRPFDTRWLFWESKTKLLDEKRADYKSHVFEDNKWLEARQRGVKEDFSRGTLCSHLADNFGNGVSSFFPMWLRDEGLGIEGNGRQLRPNLSGAAQEYLGRVDADVEDLFHHVLAVLHDPSYREANAGALRVEWPRIPVPGWSGNDKIGVADELAKSAALGRKLAALLDSDTSVLGVTTGSLHSIVSEIAVPTTVDGSNMDGTDFDVTAGWGHFSGYAVMPGQGRVVGRPFSESERGAMGDDVSVLGDTTYDVYLNDRAYWRNVPMAVWNYKLGGYQVLKKWLSYRESKVLGRPLLPDEVQHFTDTARRIATILEPVNRSR